MYISERTMVNYTLKIDPLLKTNMIFYKIIMNSIYNSIETTEEMISEIIQKFKLSKIKEFEDFGFIISR